MCIRYRETFNRANWEAPIGCDRSRLNSGGWGKVPSTLCGDKGDAEDWSEARGSKNLKMFQSNSGVTRLSVIFWTHETLPTPIGIFVPHVDFGWITLSYISFQDVFLVSRGVTLPLPSLNLCI